MILRKLLILTTVIFTICSSVHVNADVIQTGSLGNCKVTSVNGTGVASTDTIFRNLQIVKNDAGGGVTLRCLMDLRSDLVIKNVKIDFSVDAASQVATRDLEPDDEELQLYLPVCRLEIEYEPGGGDYVNFAYKKNVPWGNYMIMYWSEESISSLQYNGNGYAQSAVLQCQTRYYADTTFFRGIRFYYEDK